MSFLIDPLHDPVTWYKITHGGEQVAQWDFLNKSGNSHQSTLAALPSDRTTQKAYCKYMFYRTWKRRMIGSLAIYENTVSVFMG